MRHLEIPFCHIKEAINAQIFSSMLCTSKNIHSQLGTTWETSLIIGNSMRIKVTTVEWTWVGLELPPVWYIALYTCDIV